MNPVETVSWQVDGTPASPRFGDIYHSRSGALAQSRHVFLAGCGLPAAWQGQRRHVVAETGFGLGLNFLATWQAWRDDPKRCEELHYVAVEAWPVGAQDILRAGSSQEGLEDLARELANAYPAEPVPGFHRLRLAGGRVTLTLCIGEVLPVLRQWRFAADSVFLDGFSPARNPQMWEPQVLKALARNCRPGARAATWTVAGAVRKALTEAGFHCELRPGLPPKRDALAARYEPRWPVAPVPAPAQRQVLVIGAGLAGAAVAHALARRGWSVQLVGQSLELADGASGLPTGLLSEHRTARETALSRLTSTGVRLTLSELDRLLPSSADWARTPIETLEVGQPGTTLPGARVRPGALVAAWIADAGKAVQCHLGRRVQELRWHAGAWQALDAQGQLIAQAPVCVLAAAFDTAALGASAGLAASVTEALQPVKGQYCHGPLPGEPASTHPLRGDGLYIPRFQLDGRVRWGTGATYERGQTNRDATPEGLKANLARVHSLTEPGGLLFEQQIAAGEVKTWAAVRCASADRLPVVGAVPDDRDARAGMKPGDLPRRAGLYLLTGLGSRGLALAALAAELLAAQIEGEPLPLERSLAEAVDPARLVLRRLRRAEAQAAGKQLGETDADED